MSNSFQVLPRVQAGLALAALFVLVFGWACDEHDTPESTVASNAEHTDAAVAPENTQTSPSEGVPGFGLFGGVVDAIEAEPVDPLEQFCDMVNYPDALVFARVTDIRFVTEHPYLDGKEVHCDHPEPAIELHFERVHVLAGSVPERFIMRLGADLEVSPPVRRNANQQFVWESDKASPFRALQVGQVLGMTLRDLGVIDGTELWTFVWPGWFGLSPEQRVIQHPTMQGNMDLSYDYDKLPLGDFAKLVDSCQAKLDAEALVEVQQAASSAVTFIRERNLYFRPRCLFAQPACTEPSCASKP
ncbi:MAG: hypothetical protein RBU37_09445 [Myxococcota bacterium]|jgi:hypothetical protein|nr:hypothetical protein [Myxococcota bacterium]